MKTQRITYIRHGECNPEKCGSACCKLLNEESDKKFFEPEKGVCKYLKDGKCSIYNYKPLRCSSFPDSPNHPIYKKVKDVCGYWFERKVEEIDE
ncbi:MAG: hypothetical protein U9O94_04360 [Nanoarchaeota archaeon]|nr:hypothetical protein [Nanoarchaeota archaeon]